MKNGQIYTHAKSGKLYMINDYRLERGDAPVATVWVIGQRNGKDFGPVRTIDRAMLIGPIEDAK